MVTIVGCSGESGNFGMVDVGLLDFLTGRSFGGDDNLLLAISLSSEARRLACAFNLFDTIGLDAENFLIVGLVVLVNTDLDDDDDDLG